MSANATRQCDHLVNQTFVLASGCVQISLARESDLFLARLFHFRVGSQYEQMK